ncbi:MAG: SUF system NifU family Fe-S cluster assembly protein [Candidatus Micrarchaeaceae archaeon]
MTDNLFAEQIISNYEHPHNKGRIENPSVKHHEFNPTCGDELTLYLKINDGKVSDVKFEGSGCAISMASASMLTDFVKGKTLGEIEKMGVKDIIDLIGLDPGPARLKCATLSLRTLKEAIFISEHKKVDSETKKL